MILYKIIGTAFVTVVCYNLLKNAQPGAATLAVTAAGILILIWLSDEIVNAIGFLRDFADKSGLQESVFSSLLKIVGIGYLTEYSASVCNDGGCSSLAKKIEISGKLIILISSFPILRSVATILTDLL